MNRILSRKESVPLDNAEHPNDCWSPDCMSDSLTDGRSCRAFDDFNREGLAIEVDRALPSARVVRVLDQVAEERGYPRKLRSDNGLEFLAHALAAWAERHNVKRIPIEPGKPTQNAYVERYNRTFRQEVLDLYAFSDLDEMRDESTRWLDDYNHDRPHRSLDRLPPSATRIETSHDPWKPLLLNARRMGRITRGR